MNRPSTGGEGLRVEVTALPLRSGQGLGRGPEGRTGQPPARWVSRVSSPASRSGTCDGGAHGHASRPPRARCRRQGPAAAGFACVPSPGGVGHPEAQPGRRDTCRAARCGPRPSLAQPPLLCTPGCPAPHACKTFQPVSRSANAKPESSTKPALTHSPTLSSPTPSSRRRHRAPALCPALLQVPKLTPAKPTLSGKGHTPWGTLSSKPQGTGWHRAGCPSLPGSQGDHLAAPRPQSGTSGVRSPWWRWMASPPSPATSSSPPGTKTLSFLRPALPSPVPRNYGRGRRVPKLGVRPWITLPRGYAVTWGPRAAGQRWWLRPWPEFLTRALRPAPAARAGLCSTGPVFSLDAQ